MHNKQLVVQILTSRNKCYSTILRVTKYNKIVQIINKTLTRKYTPAKLNILRFINQQRVNGRRQFATNTTVLSLSFELCMLWHVYPSQSVCHRLVLCHSQD